MTFRVYDILLQNAELVSAGDVPLMQLQGILSDNPHQKTKRLADVILSLIALFITVPLALIIMAAIKLDSPGPVFYVQQRSGIRGRDFNLYKFRTMVADAEKKTGPVLAGKTDPRITRVGHFLRKTRLDEIPQFFNVLVGTLSLVGPRPERPYFVNKFTETIPEFDYRTQIMGGLTGLAQVEGKYSTDPSHKLSYDLLYAQKKSVMLDLVILLRTAKVLLMKTKAS